MPPYIPSSPDVRSNQVFLPYYTPIIPNYEARQYPNTYRRYQVAKVEIDEKPTGRKKKSRQDRTGQDIRTVHTVQYSPGRPKLHSLVCLRRIG